MPFPSKPNTRIFKKELSPEERQSGRYTDLAEGLAPIARKKTGRQYVPMKDRAKPVSDSDKLNVVSSFITRAEKLFKLPTNDLSDGTKALIEWLNFKNGKRAKIIGANRKALAFIINRIDSLDYAFNEGNISQDEYRSGFVEAVVGLNAMVKKLKARRETLKQEVLNAPDLPSEKPSDAFMHRLSEVGHGAASKLGSFADLQREFKKVQEAEAAERKREAALAAQASKLPSAELNENDELAAKSLVILSRFDKEKDRVLRACSQLNNPKSDVLVVRFVATIMVRVEGVIPKEMSMLRLHMHNIGGGFYIIENQTLIAFRNSYYGQTFKDLRPVRDDYYFMEPSIAAKEIRWFMPKGLIKYTHNLNFSVIAFPWTKKWEPPKEEKAETKAIPMSEKREIIIRIAQHQPEYVSIIEKIDKQQAAIEALEKAYATAFEADEAIKKQIASMEATRATTEHALERKRIDARVAAAKTALAESQKKLVAQRETLTLKRSTLAQLKKRRPELWDATVTKLLELAKVATDMGHDKSHEQFEKFFTSEAKIVSSK